MDAYTCTLLQHAANVFLSFRQIQKAQIMEKINNKGNVNVHRQDVVVPDCMHPSLQDLRYFFPFKENRTSHRKKNNNKILMPSMCISIHNHAFGQLSQITNEDGLVKELRLCFASTKNRRRVPHFFCSSNLLNRIK